MRGAVIKGHKPMFVPFDCRNTLKIKAKAECKGETNYEKSKTGKNESGGGNSYHLMVMITRTEMGMHKNTTMKL